MSTLNGYQLLETIGGVDDTLVTESLEFFCRGIEGGTLLPAPTSKRPRRLLARIAAAGLVAAMLCGAVTVVPLLGGPNLWQGFYGVIAPLFSPDETEEPYESEYECEAEPEEATKEPEDAEEETRKDSGSFDLNDYFNGGADQWPDGNPVTFLPSNPNRDPRPEWPTISWDPPRPQTPTVPRPNVPTPGPSPWP